MSDKRTTQRWSDEVHTDILCAMADSISFSPPQWTAIMDTLKGKGYTFTESALKQHIQKLKRKEGGTTSTSNTPVATPASKGGRKRKTDTPGPDAGTPTKKRGRKPAAKKEKSEDEDEQFETKVKLDDMDDDVQDGKDEDTEV
ncbi:uncharacterized protein B0I36DRAFT_310984 [Microdochium trichocladiopsis]|uniref:Uncharacterized protein n=1 Tax=Microdochium trichocladiopsis TaxID=1682393 RepID=A0A9P8YJI3_9PEZI|nr:uncharacterized protein B0I36DRAFT_310984 [Microdochium trichocladiopsis]KAH7040561.1 hypothetical protein B0I36DRAFT_310984 [Microdochium trichocladiopsis]